jgi:hypothetical protein
VFLVLQKKKLNFLHVYHHTTVLILSWQAYAQSISGLYFMTINYSIHFFMYGYYFLKTIGKWSRHYSPQFITIAQILQMFFGMWVCIWSCLYCSINLSTMAPTGIIYTTYLLLFSQFFFQRFMVVQSKQHRKI